MEQKVTVSLKEFGELKGMSERTVHRRLKDKKFVKRYNARQYGKGYQWEFDIPLSEYIVPRSRKT